MSRHGTAPQPAPAHLEALFCDIPDYEGDQSNRGHVSTSRWGEVEVHCKEDGCLLIYRHKKESLAGFSPLKGNFHTGHSFPSGYASRRWCRDFVQSLSTALEENRFYRLVPALELAPNVEGLATGDAFLWHSQELLLRRGERFVHVPLEICVEDRILTGEWATGDTNDLRYWLGTDDDNTRSALQKAIQCASLSYEEAFWACISCEHATVDELRAALYALRRFQLLGWLFPADCGEELWCLTPTTDEYGSVALRCMSKDEEDEGVIGTVNALLKAMGASFRVDDFLRASFPATEGLLRRDSCPNLRVELAEDSCWFEDEQEQAISMWTAHDRVEALVSWNHLATRLNSPLVPRVEPPADH